MVTAELCEYQRPHYEDLLDKILELASRNPKQLATNLEGTRFRAVMVPGLWSRGSGRSDHPIRYGNGLGGGRVCGPTRGGGVSFVPFSPKKIDPRKMHGNVWVIGTWQYYSCRGAGCGRVHVGQSDRRGANAGQLQVGGKIGSGDRDRN
jgi:hypothetical protein